MKTAAASVAGTLWLLGGMGVVFGQARDVSVSGIEGEIIDRIVAIVDRDVITLSEAEQTVAFAQLAAASALPDSAPELHEETEERAVPAEAVEGLVETRLVEREMRRFSREVVPEEIVDEAVSELKERFADERAYVRHRERFGLTETQIREEITRQLAVSRYLEQRFRALVSVTPDEVETYYREELLPDVPAAAALDLSEVSEQIRPIVAERKFNDRVEAFLDRLKSQAKIRRYVW